MNHQFEPADAAKYGIPAAVILSHFRFWIEKNRADGINQHEGRTWTYSTYKTLSVVFPYMTQQQIRWAIGKLTDDGVIIKGDYNKNRENRTIWYAFDDESAQLLNLTDPIGKINKSTIREDISSKDIKKPTKSPFTPPKELNMEAWAEFEEHRKSIRKPLTDLARKKAANILAALPHKDQQLCVDKSIQAGWTGVFPEKTKMQNSLNRAEALWEHNHRVGDEWVNSTTKGATYDA